MNQEKKGKEKTEVQLKKRQKYMWLLKKWHRSVDNLCKISKIKYIKYKKSRSYKVN